MSERSKLFSALGASRFQERICCNRDKLHAHVDQHEHEHEEVKQQWQQLEEASEKSLKDREKGMRISITAMKKSFEKATTHFSDEDNK